MGNGSIRANINPAGISLAISCAVKNLRDPRDESPRPVVDEGKAKVWIGNDRDGQISRLAATSCASSFRAEFHSEREYSGTNSSSRSTIAGRRERVHKGGAARLKKNEGRTKPSSGNGNNGHLGKRGRDLSNEAASGTGRGGRRAKTKKVNSFQGRERQLHRLRRSATCRNFPGAPPPKETALHFAPRMLRGRHPVSIVARPSDRGGSRLMAVPARSLRR